MIKQIIKDNIISIITVVLLIALVIILKQPVGVIGNEAIGPTQPFEDKTNPTVAGDGSGTEDDSSIWENGRYTTTGSFYKNSEYLATKDYVPEGTHLVYSENNYVFIPVVYDKDDNFLGFWNGSDIVETTTKTMCYINPKGLAPNKLKLIVKKNDNTAITIEESSNIHFLDKASAEAFAPQPTLTFIDDDGHKQSLENWESICDEINSKKGNDEERMSITFAIVTGDVGVNGNMTTWSEVERLQNKGFEFISHTNNHINITEKTDEECANDFESSIAALREHGCEYRYLAYPGNAINTDKIPLVKQYFETGIGKNGNVLGGPGSDNKLPLYTHWIRRYSINGSKVQIERNGKMVDVYAFQDIDTLKGYIDAAITNNSWVIIMTHLRDSDVFYYDEETREMIIELCNYATEKGVAIQNFGDAFERFKNQSEEGSIYDDDAAYKIVDCNGVLHYKN